MSRNLKPADHQNHPLQAFIKIYEKMLKNSRNFATKIAGSVNREKEQRINGGRAS